MNQLSRDRDQQLHELQESNKKLEQEKAGECNNVGLGINVFFYTWSAK